MMIRTLVYIWILLVVIAICLVTRRPRERFLAAEVRMKAKLYKRNIALMQEEEGVEIKIAKP